MTGAVESCLYFGAVMHQRLRPRRHRLDYRVFALYADLDDLPALGRRLRWFSHDRFNLLSLREKDHGDGRGDLRFWVGRELARAGIDLAGGRVGLLCYPRLFGYAFNPIAVYFCFDRADALVAILYQVNNTFGDRHCYLARVRGNDQQILRHACAKNLYVSPFIGMEAQYRFRVRAPDERLMLAIDELDRDGLLLQAATTGRRAVLDDRNILRALLSYPLMTLKVIAGIHWEALKLWRKGVALHRRPPAPATMVSVMPDTPATMPVTTINAAAE